MQKLKVIKRNRDLFIESSLQRVLEVFFIYPDGEFSLSETSKIAKVKKSNIGKILLALEKEEFIIIEILNNLWRIRANLKSQNFIRSKIVYNLGLIYQSGIVEFLNEHYKNPRVIILFGSFRKGEDIFTSDIDIAVESESNEVVKLKETAPFEKVFKRSIQIHLFNPAKTDKNLLSNIMNGFVLSGFLELK